MLKMTGLPDKLAPSKNNNIKPTSNKNNGSKLASKKNDSDNKVEYGSDSVEHAKKSRKLKAYFLGKKP